MSGNIPLPRETQHVIGHEGAIADFMTTWESGRLHHAWLVTGPRGIGKATLAYAIARWVITPDRPLGRLSLPPEHRTIRQVAANSHPALCVIEPEEDEKSGVFREISVDEARRVPPFLQLTAADDSWRVVLIDNADMLSNEGQNAILKFLEEPPARCLIILTAAQPGKLLPTIKSRSRQLKLDVLSDNDLRMLSARLDVKLQHDKPWLIRHAAGSIGELIRLADLDASTLQQMVAEIIKALPNPHWAAVHKLGEKVGRKEQDAQFRLVLELFNDALAERLKSQPAATAAWDDLQLKLRMAPERHLDRTATLIDAVAAASRMMQANMAA
ncbi:MAG: DNA polymerase III subunit delta' [Bdellovibrionales bacterium]